MSPANETQPSGIGMFEQKSWSILGLSSGIHVQLQVVNECRETPWYRLLSRHSFTT